MADVENQPDSSFPVKRKPDLCCQEQVNVANKAQKLNPSSSSTDSESRGKEVSGSGVENLTSSNSLEEAAGSLPEKDENVVLGDLGEEEDEEEIDRKGKGMSREDNGK